MPKVEIWAEPGPAEAPHCCPATKPGIWALVLILGIVAALQMGYIVHARGGPNEKLERGQECMTMWAQSVLTLTS